VRLPGSRLSQLLPKEQSRPVQAHANRALFERQNLRDLRGRNLLHIVQYQHEAIVRRDFVHSLQKDVRSLPLEQ